MRHFAPVPPGVHPRNDYPDYRSTAKRAPRQPAIAIPHTSSEISGPRFGGECLRAGSTDLTRVGSGTALGQRIVVHGRVVDERGRPQRHTVIELWPANAAGRYRHPGDTHDAPLDAHFAGSGQAVTDANGCYAFFTIEPGAKGLNLALADVALLAEALIAHYREHDDSLLDSYSQRALGRVWKAERFSWWFTALTHSFDRNDDFGTRLQQAEFDHLAESRAAQTSFAENYVGLD